MNKTIPLRKHSLLFKKLLISSKENSKKIFNFLQPVIKKQRSTFILFAKLGAVLFLINESPAIFNEGKEKENSYEASKRQLLFLETINRTIKEPNTNVVTEETKAKQQPFLNGIRLGKGKALAVLFPGTLQEAIDALRVCVEFDVAVIPQGKNSGLTGGSVPRNENERDFVVISFSRLNKIVPIKTNGNSTEVEHVLCFSGAGLFDLQNTLKSFNRESHSVLGSIFLNPSVSGGVAFGSGGTQLRKGPSYTERALYCKVNKQGKVELVNTLGFKENMNEQTIFEKLEGCDFFYENEFSTSLNSFDSNYRQKVCHLNNEPSRYNSDVSGNSECVRSEGKVFILATIHSTFPQPEKKKVFWIGCSTFQQASELKKKVILSSSADLPISCEYMNKDTIEVTDRAGRILNLIINLFGIKRLAFLWKMKDVFESLPIVPRGFSDKALYFFNPICPSFLPTSCQQIAVQFNHNVIVEVGEYGKGELGRFEDKLSHFQTEESINNREIKIYECLSEKEVQAVLTFRFSVAAAFKTFIEGRNLEGLSLDYAMKKNDFQIPKMPFDDKTTLPQPIYRLRYMHFGCNVVHEDLSFEKTFLLGDEKRQTNIEEIKQKIKKCLKELGIKLPAEHGHGIEYEASKETQERWKSLDPTNCMNPGIGGTSAKKNYEI